MVAAGAVLGLYALGLLLLGIVEVFEDVMPDWLAYMLVGLIVGAIGGCIAMLGRQRLKDAHLMPEQTVATLHEDIDVVESQMR